MLDNMEETASASVVSNPQRRGPRLTPPIKPPGRPEVNPRGLVTLRGPPQPNPEIISEGRGFVPTLVPQAPRQGKDGLPHMPGGPLGPWVGEELGRWRLPRLHYSNERYLLKHSRVAIPSEAHILQFLTRTTFKSSWNHVLLSYEGQPQLPVG